MCVLVVSDAVLLMVIDVVFLCVACCELLCWRDLVCLVCGVCWCGVCVMWCCVCVLVCLV